MPRPIKERILAKINKKSRDVCWEWTGAVSSNKQPKIWFQKKSWTVTRLLWGMAYNGGKPPGRDVKVIHSCGNPSCVNWYHLQKAQ